jgi:hypothetical protein
MDESSCRETTQTEGWHVILDGRTTQFVSVPGESLGLDASGCRRPVSDGTWAQSDLNRRPPGYQPGAPAKLSYGPAIVGIVSERYPFRTDRTEECAPREHVVPGCGRSLTWQVSVVAPRPRGSSDRQNLSFQGLKELLDFSDERRGPP